MTLERIAELNTLVPCFLHEGPLSPHYLDVFQVVVLTNSSLDEALALSDYCHSKGIKIIIADTRGLFGFDHTKQWSFVFTL